MLLALLPVPNGYAAYDPDTGALPISNLELVVVEVEGCIYCAIFRRDVLPAYEASPRAASVPMRFVDLNEIDSGQLALAAPIVSVPTVLLLKDGKEAGRIGGYVGPENFFYAINHLLAGTE
jgi:thioredoxin-related protein